MDISVVVVSYNSSKTILETLDSIRNQVFDLKKVELIISDDVSTDSTFDLALGWIEKHGSVFGRSFLVQSKSNMGVSHNCNNGWGEATGAWIKTIAADDVLANNCLALNYDFVVKNPEIRILFSKCKRFFVDINDGQYIDEDLDFFKLNSLMQNKALRSHCNLLAPTSFIQKSLFDEIGYADTRYSMIEDYPLWYRFTKHGVKIHHADFLSVYYRSGETLSQSKQRVANVRYLDDWFRFKRECIWPDLSFFDLLIAFDDVVLYFNMRIGIVVFGNKRTFLFNLISKLLIAVRPYRVLRYLKSRLLK